MPKKKGNPGPPVNRNTASYRKARASVQRSRAQSRRSKPRGLASSMRVSAPATQSRRRGAYFRVQSADSVKYKEAIRIQGQDFVQTVTGTGQLTGVNVVTLPINPIAGAFEGTRLNKFAELYDKYVFNTIKFHYDPACPTSTVGSLVMAYDRDPTDTTPPSSTHGIQQYFAMMDAQSAPVWAEMTVTAQRSDPQDFFYANKSAQSDERLTDQGQIYLAAVTTLPSGPLGNLWVEYDITLFDPQLEDVDSVNEGVAPATAWTNAAKQGFNGLADNVVEGRGITNLVDDAGNTFYRFAPGVYTAMLGWNAASASTKPAYSAYVNGVSTPGIIDLFRDDASGTNGSVNAFFDVPKTGADIYAAWTAASTAAGSRTFYSWKTIPEVLQFSPS